MARICGSLQLVSVLCVWFTATVCVLLHNKTILDRGAQSVTPLQITFGQSTVSMCMDCVIIVSCAVLHPTDMKGNSNSVNTKNALIQSLSDVFPNAARRRQLLPLCAAFVVTKLLTLNSIALIPTSLTYTIKATSPIFTVVISYFVYGRVFSSMTYLSLVPISVGVAMAAISEFQFSAIGLICAVTSVGMGVGYQMYMKSMMDGSRHKATLVRRASATDLSNSPVAVVALDPEGTPTPSPNGTPTHSPVSEPISPKLSVSSSSSFTLTSPPLAAAMVAAKAEKHSLESNFYFNFVNTTTLHVQIAMSGMLGTFLIGVVQSSLSSSSAHPPSAESIAVQAGSNSHLSASDTDNQPHPLWDLPVGILLVNGLLNYVASLSSYILLSMTTNLAWQITNAMKRLTVIVASVLYFQNPLTAINICGVGLAIAGVSLYETVRQPVVRNRRSPAKLERLDPFVAELEMAPTMNGAAHPVLPPPKSV